MTVPATEAFAVEGGVIVHNCMDAMRYLVMSGSRVATVEPVKRASSPSPRILGDATVGY